MLFFYFQSLPQETSKTFPLEQWQIAARQLKHKHYTEARYCSEWGIPFPWYKLNGLFHFSFKNALFMHTPEPRGTVSCQSCSLKVITEAKLRWCTAQNLWGKTCWRDEHEHSWHLSGGISSWSAGVELGLWVLVWWHWKDVSWVLSCCRRESFCNREKKGNGWCFMRDLIVDHSTWVREVAKEDLWPREANFYKSQSCRNIWCFSWTGKELEKSIGVAPCEKSFYFTHQTKSPAKRIFLQQLKFFFVHLQMPNLF